MLCMHMQLVDERARNAQLTSKLQVCVCVFPNSAYVHAWMSKHVSACVGAHMGAYVRACACYMCVHMGACTCVHMHLYVCVYAHGYRCVCAQTRCAHVHMCIRIHMGLREQEVETALEVLQRGGSREEAISNKQQLLLHRFFPPSCVLPPSPVIFGCHACICVPGKWTSC